MRCKLVGSIFLAVSIFILFGTFFKLDEYRKYQDGIPSLHSRSLEPSPQLFGVEKTNSQLTINHTHNPLPNTKKVVIHRFWASHTFNRKVQTAILSSLRTQTNANVIIWTLPTTLSSVLGQMQSLQKMSCPSNSTLEVRSISELQNVLSKSKDDSLMMCAQSFNVMPNDMVALSDLIRFISLYIYGGIYADADVIFMRDMRDMHGLAFAYKWDRNVMYYNTAIMGLPMRSAVVPQIIKHFKSCNADTFYPTRIHEALTCDSGVCNELLMMPTALFGPVSAPQSNWHWQSDESHEMGTSTSWFFDRERRWNIDHFFPGAYTFHWHNRWDHPIHPDSWFADLERLNFVSCGQNMGQQNGNSVSDANMIMGFASGYNLRDLGYFIQSAIECMPEAKLVLFVNRMEDALIKNISQIVIVLISSVRLTEDFSDSPVIKRFNVYRSWLNNFNQFEYGFKPRQIFLTDVRDVFFQSDVFTPMVLTGIHFFAEGLLLRDEQYYNHPWIRECRGEDTLQQMLGQGASILNGGVVGASDIPSMLEYLGEMVRGLREGCNDQGWLNILAQHERTLKTPVHIHNLTLDGDSWVSHCLLDWNKMPHLKRAESRAHVKIDAAGRLINPRGDIVYALIHQGDRFNEVWELRHNLPQKGIKLNDPIHPLRQFHDFEF